MRNKASWKGLARASAAWAVAGWLGCGGGGSGSSSGSQTNIAGAWILTANNTTYHTLVLPGTFAFRSLDTNLLESSGTFTLSGSTLGGTISIFPSALFAAAGYPKQVGTISGTASATSLHDTVTVPLGVATTDNSLDIAANVPVQLADLAGSFTAAPGPAATASGLGGTFTVSAAGAVAGSDSAGSFQGALTPVSAGLNAFSAALTYTPTAGGAPLAYAGLAYLRPGTPSVLILMTDDGTASFAGFFSKQ
jgi:hypothetical protein